MIYLIGILIIFVLILIALSIRRTPGDLKYSDKYVSSLEFIIEGKKDRALESLKETVREELGNTDAYVYLGDLMREKGKTETAIKIHENVMAKPNLNKKDKVKVLKSLGKDYVKHEDFSRALKLYEDLHREEPGEISITEELLNLYEREGDWDSAFRIAREIYKGENELAHYSIYIAENLIDSDINRAKKYIKRGLRKEIGYANYLYGKILIKEGNEEKGIDKIKEGINMDPDKAFIYLPELEEYMYKRGKFAAFEPYLKGLIEDYSDNWSFISTYVSILKKKGEEEKAERMLNKFLDSMEIEDPELLTSIAGSFSDIDYEKTQELLAKIEELLKKNKRFKCKECMNEVKSFSWKCPVCSSLGTVDRVWGG